MARCSVCPRLSGRGDIGEVRLGPYDQDMPTAAVEDLRRAQRILLYGVTGSGKTTAADLIAAALGLPSHHVDDEIGWLPHWTERPDEDQRRLATELAGGERWVIDSAYGKWRDLVVPRAEAVVALDYPRWLSLSRLVHRTVARLVLRDPICNGNQESLTNLLSRNGIIAWHFRSFQRKHVTILAMESATEGPPVVRLRHPRDLTRLLAALTM